MIRNTEIKWPVSLMYAFLMILLGFIAVSMLAEIRPLLIVSAVLALMLPLIYLLVFRFNLLIFILVLSIPLSFRLQTVGTIAVSFPAELLAGAIALFYLIYRLLGPGQEYGRIFRHPLTVLIILDLSWLFITMLFSEMPIISLKRFLVRLTFAVVFYFAFTDLFRNRRNVASVWILYAAGLVIPVISTLYNHSLFDFSKSVSNLMTAPFYNDHTQYATCIAFVLPVLGLVAIMPERLGFSKSTRFFMIPLIGILVAGEIYSFSRAAWISIAVSFALSGLVALFKFRLVHFILLALIAGGIVYVNFGDLEQYAEKVNSESRSVDVGEHLRSVLNIQTDPSNLERINRWHSAIGMFKDRPLTGFGPGTYQFIYGKYQLTSEMTGISTRHGEKGNAHSEYLTYLSETGLPGFIIFSLLILAGFSTAVRIYRKKRRVEVRWLSLAIMMGYIAYFFHGLFNSFIDTDKAAVLVYGSFAALVALEIYHGNETNKPVRSNPDLTG